MQVITKGMEPQLLRLKIPGNGLGASGGAILGANLAACHHLSFLDLSHNSLGQKGCLALVEGLKFCTWLTFLALANNGIGAGGAQGMKESLKTLTKLVDLDVAFNGLKDPGVEQIAALIQDGRLNQLQTLKLQGNGIGDKGTQVLAKALAKTCPKLQMVDLRRNTIKEKGAIGLGKLLYKVVSLDEVYLQQNLIPDQGKEALDNALLDSATFGIKNYDSLNFAQKMSAKKEAAAKRHIHLKYNNLHKESLSEKLQFKDKKDIKFCKKRSFMVEVGVSHLPLIG